MNLPLILQGFPTVAVQPATVENFHYQIETNRGDLYKLDYLDNNPNQLTEAVFTGSLVTLTAGGIELITNEPTSRYGYTFNLGEEKREPIRIKLNDAQTLDLTIDNDPLLIPVTAAVTGQVLAYYTNEEHQEYLKNLKLKFGKGQKRLVFIIGVAVGAGAGTTQVLSDIIPRNRGKIIGFSILAISSLIVAREITLEVNGIEIVKTVNSARFSRFCKRDPFFFPVPLDAGATFKLKIDIPAIAPPIDNEYYYVTFYFDN